MRWFNAVEGATFVHYDENDYVLFVGFGEDRVIVHNAADPDNVDQVDIINFDEPQTYGARVLACQQWINIHYDFEAEHARPLE